jgi:hypothetical protein
VIREEQAESTPLPPFKLESKKAIRFAPLDSAEEIPGTNTTATGLGLVESVAPVGTTDGESPVSNLTQNSSQSSQSASSQLPLQVQQAQQGKTQVKKGRFSVVESSIGNPTESGPRIGSPKPNVPQGQGQQGQQQQQQQEQSESPTVTPTATHLPKDDQGQQGLVSTTRMSFVLHVNIYKKNNTLNTPMQKQWSVKWDDLLFSKRDRV